MTPEFAGKLVALRASAEVQVGIDDLAETCNEGRLSVEERAEYGDFIGAIHLIGVLQRQARRVLAEGAQS